jgi:fatty acid-binding protein DegV
MKVSLIVDSGCDITKSEADKENIIFLPLKTLFGDKEYLDGVTITHKEFYEKLIEGDETPTTSQVAPYEFEEAYRKHYRKATKL